VAVLILWGPKCPVIKQDSEHLCVVCGFGGGFDPISTAR
jgi:hypothetical protein